MNLDQLYLVQANASQLPFKKSSFHGVTCSHAFYELQGDERTRAIDEVARILIDGGRFCLMEHAKPKKAISETSLLCPDLLSWCKGCEEVSCWKRVLYLGERFKNITKVMSPTGQSKLIYGEKGG